MKILIIIILIVFVQVIQAQSFMWAKRSGGPSSDASKCVVSDVQGNSYVTGRFKGPATFESQTIYSTGANDLYVAKYSSTGNLLWVKQAGSTSQYGHIVGRAVDVNSNGDVFVTGDYDSTINFGSGLSISANGHASDIFVAKYNSSGLIQWVISCGGTEHDFVDDIIVDESGNSFITGQFYGNAQFGPFNLVSGGWADVFLAKLNFSGNFQWAKKGGGSNFDAAYGSAFDNSGNLIITGTFTSSALFGSISFTANGAAAFILKYDNNGNALSGLQSSGNTDGVWPTDIAVSASNEIYICGFYYQNIQFGTINLFSAGINDCFIAKINTALNWEWAKSGGGTNYDYFEALSLLENGNVYTVGSFSSTANFNGINLVSSGNTDIVFAGYESNGNIAWAIRTGNTGIDHGNGISIASNNYIFFTGEFSGNTIFPPNIQLTSNGEEDSFLARLDSLVVFVQNKQTRIPDNFSLSQNYPNPFNPKTKIQFSIPWTSNVNLTVYDILGREISVLVNEELKAGNYNADFDAGDLSSGIYFYKIIAGDFNETKKMILVR
ncbi:MAG: T9SS C-terminal target domain-containing protein [Ignavibacteriae bacterium]|nr:MAG: T9SS C-terminal target domain-containing protein [Ignavibacteriota bacterium]